MILLNDQLSFNQLAVVVFLSYHFSISLGLARSMDKTFCNTVFELDAFLLVLLSRIIRHVAQ